ncbi:TELO2-interacting protein 1 homolog [Agrilus planipennis]|uniref:TELO2-interacting protein 1 homolog n=1 Tax=Agrilus planipennis TaxID=224129 RepID=A0A7F5R1Q7_AGRPL|nr:TELO2-interacting protein 1 homolog [Agrilus planipennis]
MDCKEITKLIKVKHISEDIIKTPENVEKIMELNYLLGQIQGKLLQNVHHIIICSFYPIFKKAAENKQNIKQDVNASVVETLTTLFGKIQIEKIEIFLNIYGYLLNEIYDPKVKNCVALVHEEYKLLLVNCITALTRCLTWDVITNLYTKVHAPKLCQIIYVIVEIAKTEHLRKLRISAIKCLMTLARIEDCDISQEDVVLQAQVADVFIFFLPGIASGLKDIALEDEKFGHAVVVESVKAFGRLVTLIMKDPNNPEEKVQINLQLNINNKFNCTNNDQQLPKKKWTNEKEVNDYLQSMKRDEKFFKETDSKLQLIVKVLRKLTHHSHPRVREELSNICKGFVQYCSNTMTLSMCYITEILIALSEDEYKNVSETAKEALEILSRNFNSNSYRKIEENLEEKFYEMTTDLPRIFNSLEEQQQLSALNMLIGYLRLFNKNKLVHILYSQAHLQRLLLALINITKMETNEITQLEDFILDAFADETSSTHFLPNFKKFKYIQNEKIASKLTEVCSLLANEDVLDIVSDSLITIIQNNEEIKEAIYLLNEVLFGIKDKTRVEIFENVITTYLDPEYWDLPLHTIDSDGNKHSLGEVQNNILQVCLLAEGFGKIASSLGPNIQQFLLKIMYPILERAGSPQPLVRRVGLESLKKIATACGYNTITDLVNANNDYFSYHITRKFQKVGNDENALNVLCVVMQHSNIDVLPSISDIIEGILIQTFDKYFQEQKAEHYLYIFKTFTECLMKWLDIKPVLIPIKSKIETKEQIEDFKVTGLEDITNFSDDIMEKSAEDMFKDDMAKSKKELLEDGDTPEDEYKKPEPPTYVKLTVLLLKRCLHFLPAKNKNTKLFALEILKNGLEIIRDWEDELLPMVHQIWSPLVNRFSDKELVIVNYSFQLLITLARLSKWFVRSRTVKEAFPNILTLLDKLSKESYLKDKGSPYRYTQAYKLQLTLLENLARIVVDLEMIDKDTEKIIFSVLPYLSDKQPLPLQELSVKFFKDLITYDSKILTKILEEGNFSESEYSKNMNIIKTLL